MSPVNRVSARLTPEHPLLFSVVISFGYAIAYLLQSWPQTLRFWSHSWLDDGDGLVMVWNVWLARQQGLNFVNTDFIFAPEGVSLLAHTYAPLKGWIGALLPLPLIPSVNLLILASFALAGTFTFWLARRFSTGVWGCLLAGYAFTFTSFHWAHARGHMNLLSTEVLPLYALLWLRYEERPNWTRAAAVATALLATALTDYYFASYCCLLTLIFVIGKRMSWRDLGRVCALVIPTTGLLALAALRIMRGGELLGAHDPAGGPLDPVSLFVYGGDSFFADLTSGIWASFPGNIAEHSVHLGLTLWVAILWKARCRRWWAVLGVFLVLALGERLTVLGHTLPIPMPYEFLEWVMPPLALGGVPVRMVVMVALAASVLLAIAMNRFGREKLALSVVLLVELFPAPRPLTRLETPGWVEILESRRDRGPLFDPYTDPRQAMFWQTRHGHPISGGVVARTPAAALALNDSYFELFKQSSPDPLVRAGFEYILIQDYSIGGATLLWQGGNERLYHMVPASESGVSQGR